MAASKNLNQNAEASHSRNYESFPRAIQQPSESCFNKFSRILKKNWIWIGTGVILLLVVIVTLVVVLNNGRDENDEDFPSFTTTTALIEETTGNDQPTSSTTTQAPNFIDIVLYEGNCLTRRDILRSEERCFYLTMQNDGNLVIYRSRDDRLVWSTNTSGTDGSRACMQTDGNFVVYNNRYDIIWQPSYWWRVGHVFNSFNQPDRAILQDDGQLVLKKVSNSKWESEVKMLC